MVDSEPRRRGGEPPAARHREEGAKVVPVEIGHAVWEYMHNGLGTMPMDRKELS
jgi:hypothetical protein